MAEQPPGCRVDEFSAGLRRDLINLFSKACSAQRWAGCSEMTGITRHHAACDFVLGDWSFFFEARRQDTSGALCLTFLPSADFDAPQGVLVLCLVRHGEVAKSPTSYALQKPKPWEAEGVKAMLSDLGLFHESDDDNSNMYAFLSFVGAALHFVTCPHPGYVAYFSLKDDDFFFRRCDPDVYSRISSLAGVLNMLFGHDVPRWAMAAMSRRADEYHAQQGVHTATRAEAAPPVPDEVVDPRTAGWQMWDPRPAPKQGAPGWRRPRPRLICEMCGKKADFVCTGCEVVRYCVSRRFNRRDARSPRSGPGDLDRS